ncbi:MAG: arsenite methyltransferase [Phycisphaerae bacterium]
MTPVNKFKSVTPKIAATVKSALDQRLDPDLFKVLGEPTRAKLLACLLKCGRPCSVTEVAECCAIDFSMVARHLSALARAKLLRARKSGRTMWYEAPATALASRFRALADAIDEASKAGCCTPGSIDVNDHQKGIAMENRAEQTIRESVRVGYAKIAETGQFSGVVPNAAEAGASCCGGGGCCGPTTLTADDVARAVGYADDELDALPQGANMGLSCGNPTAIAGLALGETVLDLGSGGGFDCFIAGRKVGATGRVIGVDMTPEMIRKARGNVDAYVEQTGLENVEFRLGEIEHLPVADASVDVVISNCVINLSPDKDQTWREIARVLKPGGRVAVSDLALRQPLPEAVLTDVEALVGCVAGADLVDDVRASVTAAGLTEIMLIEKPEYVDAMTSWQDPLYQKIAARLPADAKMSDYVVSLDVVARRTRSG